MVGEQFQFTPEFEDLIVAAYISDPERFLVYGNILKPEFFSSTVRMLTIEAANTFMVKYGTLPSWQSVSQLLADQAEDLGKPAKEFTDYAVATSRIQVTDVQFVVDKIVSFCRERATINAVKKAIKDLKDGTMPEQGFANMFEDALKIGQNLDDMGCLLNSDTERVIDKILRPDYGVKTGITQFDRIWKNGWLPGWLIVPVAPPKRYKSMVCANIGLSVAGHSSGHDVIYYTCEISQELAVQRALFNITGLGEDVMFSTPEAFKQAAKDKLAELLRGKFLIKHFPLGTAKISDLEAHTKLVRKSLGINPKLIIIDYADTVLPADTTSALHKQQADVYKEAIAFGHRQKAAILMPDRCTAEAVERATPNIKSFQGAFAKGGLVDIAFGLCATDQEYKENILRTFVFVNRWGPAFQHFQGTVDPARASISFGNEIEWNPEEDEKDDKKSRRGGRRGDGQSMPAEFVEETTGR